MGQQLHEGYLLDHGKYRIIRVLGQGGFGITYLAMDMGLDKLRAIKEFFPKDYCERNDSTSHVTLGNANTAEFVDRLKKKFVKEAKNIAQLDQHNGIINIHAVFEDNNTAYYVMDYIEGESLSAMVKKTGPLPAWKALNYITKVGNALEYVHKRHINHLDVKPANIMVRSLDDEPILIDFGLSKQYDSEGFQTSTTPTGISHGFAPFEQYKQGGVKEFSPQTDIYALAASLYYLVSGAVPPPATDLIEDELTFPGNFPNYLIGPIRKAMSVNRKNRFSSIPEFISALSGNNSQGSQHNSGQPNWTYGNPSSGPSYNQGTPETEVKSPYSTRSRYSTSSNTAPPSKPPVKDPLKTQLIKIGIWTAVFAACIIAIILINYKPSVNYEEADFLDSAVAVEELVAEEDVAWDSWVSDTVVAVEVPAPEGYYPYQ